MLKSKKSSKKSSLKNSSSLQEIKTNEMNDEINNYLPPNEKSSPITANVGFLNFLYI